MKIELFENYSNSTQGNTNGMGAVRSPQPSVIPGQVNTTTVPCQEENAEIKPEENIDNTVCNTEEKIEESLILNFEQFLNEDGEASATMGNGNGMGAVTAPIVSATPGDVAGSVAGSGDVVARSVNVATKQPVKKMRKLKKVRKPVLKPQIKNFTENHTERGLGKDLNDKSTMYVARYSDWNYPTLEHMENDEYAHIKQKEENEEYLYKLKTIADELMMDFDHLESIDEIELQDLVKAKLEKEIGVAEESDINWIIDYISEYEKISTEEELQSFDEYIRSKNVEKEEDDDFEDIKTFEEFSK